MNRPRLAACLRNIPLIHRHFSKAPAEHPARMPQSTAARDRGAIGGGTGGSDEQTDRPTLRRRHQDCRPGQAAGWRRGDPRPHRLWWQMALRLCRHRPQDGPGRPARGRPVQGLAPAWPWVRLSLGAGQAGRRSCRPSPLVGQVGGKVGRTYARSDLLDESAAALVPLRQNHLRKSLGAGDWRFPPSPRDDRPHRPRLPGRHRIGAMRPAVASCDDIPGALQAEYDHANHEGTGRRFGHSLQGPVLRMSGQRSSVSG